MLAGLALLPPGGPPDWHEADYVSYVEGQSRFDLELYRHLDLQAPGLAGLPDVVAAISCPVLLLTARPTMPGVDVEAEAAAFTASLATVRHVHIADSGHAIPADRFARFIDKVRGLLDDAIVDPGGS